METPFWVGRLSEILLNADAKIKIKMNIEFINYEKSLR